jgi:hypothetical protein
MTAPDLLPHLLAVVDDLESLEPQAALPRRLLSATALVNENQDLGHSNEDVAEAVARHLSVIAPKMALTDSPDFGWDRPKDPVAHRARQAQQNNGRLSQLWRHLHRKLNMDIVSFAATGGILISVAPLLLMSCVEKLMHLPDWACFCIGSFIIFSGLALWAMSVSKIIHQDLDLDLLDKKMLSENFMKRCEDSPKAKVYIEHCLTSDLPDLLEGDVIQLRNHVMMDDERSNRAQHAADLRKRFLKPRHAG